MKQTFGNITISRFYKKGAQSDWVVYRAQHKIGTLSRTKSTSGLLVWVARDLSGKRLAENRLKADAVAYFNT